MNVNLVIPIHGKTHKNRPYDVAAGTVRVVRLGPEARITHAATQPLQVTLM